MNYIKFVSAFLFGMCASSHATIIIVHGSFAAESTWYQPEGNFYKAVQSATHQPLYSFSWSGEYKPEKIIAETTKLVELLLSLDINDPITIAAHSNGGNLCLYASLFLRELFKATESDLDKAKRSIPVAPSCLLKPFTPNYKAQDLQQRSYSRLHSCLNTCFDRLKKLFLQKKETRPKEQFVSALYLMGTPFNIDIFPPDMTIVHTIYNLYSEKDIVQNFAGSQQLPEHKRMANLHVSIHDRHECHDCLTLALDSFSDDETETEEIVPPDDYTTLHPCHSCLHQPIIGRWLLSLADLVQPESRTTHLHDGEVVFYHDQQPDYRSYQGQLAADSLQNDQA